MLSIGKLGASRRQLAYYEQQVAAGIEDYYAGCGEAPGRWRGSGLAALGVSTGGRVEREAFMALMHGSHPESGAELRRMGSCSTVAALDLTFSAPKSVSVLFAIADDEMGSSALVAAHERAVDEALAYLEREACFTRRGHGGAERIVGEGFVAASYRHRLSRAGDPQLHTHLVVANLALADGRYTALDAHALYEHKNAAGAVYRAVLRAQVRERLPWVSWRAAGRGLFEIDCVPEAVLRHFSQRRVEIEDRAAELVAGGAGGLSRERMQGIALQTRQAKEYGLDGGGWREQARARAAEHGFGRAELAALLARASSEARVDLDALFARLSGEDGLTGRHNAFARHHALAEIAGAFPQGAAAAELDAVTRRYLADPQVVALQREGEPRLTTSGLLACEQQIIDGADRRAGERTAVLTPFFLDRVVQQHEPSLNEEQATVVRRIACSGHGVEAVQALAGTGKTTMLAAVAECYRQARYRVIGAAPTARAARQLRETAGIPATTMHSLLYEVDHAGGFADRTVLLLDEAGMAPTRLTAALLAHAERAGAKVITVGDPGQLQSVQAGGWLATLAGQQPELALREVIRQHDPAEREALAALHDGQPERYLDYKSDDISLHTDEHDAAESLLDQWHARRATEGVDAVAMIVRDNQTRELLNHRARQRLRAQNQLAATGVRIGAREYAPGDRVIARRNDHQLQVDNGTLGTVTAIDFDHMHLRLDSGETRTLTLPYVAGHLEHAYALTAHGAQGATVTWAGVLGRPEEFTREWAYTALSRARKRTVLHILADWPSGTRDTDAYDPLTPSRSRDESLRALSRAMRRSEGEPLAAQQLANGRALDDRLATAHLARQRELDRLALVDLRRDLPGATRLRRVGDQRRQPQVPECCVRLRP